MSKLISRRTLLKSTAAVAVSNLLIPRFGIASTRLDKKIALYNMHTGEWFKQTYIQNGSYIPEILKELNYFLRDHRSGDVHPIDPKLLDLLHRLQKAAGSGTVFDVISGYRSPKTNASLRRKGAGVARNSYHMQGKAIDVKCPKMLKFIRDLAKSYAQGGVGYYPRSGFIHLDIRLKPTYWQS